MVLIRFACVHLDGIDDVVVLVVIEMDIGIFSVLLSL